MRKRYLAALLTIMAGTLASFTSSPQGSMQLDSGSMSSISPAQLTLNSPHLDVADLPSTF